jgi:predicted AlkP superfamily phosphohydrolase/phosphomutase
MPARVLIIALDGATFDLIEPWAGAGDLPSLAGLMRAGAWGPMRSTVPAATFPAWTSLMTGVNPGKHGVYDFTRRVPGTYQVEFINATYRQYPSAWQVLSQAGRRVAVIGLPATYPPERLNGLCISGFDSPVATGIDRSFVQPPELYDHLKQAVGSYEITGFQELHIGPRWHEAALDKLLQAAQRRTEISAYLLDREPWDCFLVHYGESDTVAHHFWSAHDHSSPRYDKDLSAEQGHAIHTVYRALDSAVGELVARAGSGTTVMVVSDHGSGGTGEHIVHLNRWLSQQGWLRFTRASAAGRLATPLKRIGLALPASLQERAFRGPLRPLAGRLESSSRLGGIDWAATKAFSEEVNTLPAIWLNVQGREPSGTVAPGERYENLRDEILARLSEWRNPVTGERVVGRAWRREELYSGSAVESAPDILLELALDRGYAYTCLSSQGRPGEPLARLEPSQRLGAKGSSMNGSHRPHGMLILAGQGIVSQGHPTGAQIVDLAPTLFELLDVPHPAGLDGRALSESVVTSAGGHVDQEPAEPMASPVPYTKEQAEVVRARLQGLGYQA